MPVFSARVALLTLFLHALSFAAFGQEATDSAPGLRQGIIFAEYSTQSSSIELARRTLSPLANAALARAVAESGVRAQPVDLAREFFSVYVPSRRPPQGYGLLVFVPPWQNARLPAGWAGALDESGMIFVSASRSGNEENVLDRRLPLAILAAYNIMHRYAIDGDRIYIAGFSGGSRVAMRTALAYPDLFRGAILNAGSDVIGTPSAALPPGDLFSRFQGTRLVYVTGTADEQHFKLDLESRDSMNHWCVFGTSLETMAGMGHEIAAPSYLRHALETLDRRAPVDEDNLAACKDRLAQELASDLHHVGELLDRGRSRDAWRSLTKIDDRYGGLAAPESIELAGRMGPRR